MAGQHAPQDQGGDGQRLLVRKPEPQVGVEARQPIISPRGIDAAGGGVDEQRHVQFGARPINGIERAVVERSTEVGADARAEQTEVGHRSLQLGDGLGRVLHGQLGQPAEAVTVVGHDVGQAFVVTAAEPDRRFGVDVLEERERVGREDLELDAPLVHLSQPQLHVHERAGPILDPDELVVTDAVARQSTGLGVGFLQKRPVVAGRAQRLLQHHVGMQIDHELKTTG